MQPALCTPIAQPLVPSWAELSEKPRLGFTSRNAAWNPGPNVPNSTAAIGMRAGLALEGIRSRCSGEQYDSDLGLYYLRARYYNPATGRFLSRDPLDGRANDPKTLHKYIYAGGDPVNAIDPTGRDLFETALLDSRSSLEKAVISRAGLSIAGCFLGIAATIHEALEGWSAWGAAAGGIACLEAISLNEYARIGSRSDNAQRCVNGGRL
jgi:RHS repeat-associated protein